MKKRQKDETENVNRLKKKIRDVLHKSYAEKNGSENKIKLESRLSRYFQVFLNPDGGKKREFFNKTSYDRFKF